MTSVPKISGEYEWVSPKGSIGGGSVHRARVVELPIPGENQPYANHAKISFDVALLWVPISELREIN